MCWLFEQNINQMRLVLISSVWTTASWADTCTLSVPIFVCSPHFGNIWQHTRPLHDHISHDIFPFVTAYLRTIVRWTSLQLYGKNMLLITYINTKKNEIPFSSWLEPNMIWIIAYALLRRSKSHWNAFQLCFYHFVMRFQK